MQQVTWILFLKLPSSFSSRKSKVKEASEPLLFQTVDRVCIKSAGSRFWCSCVVLLFWPLALFCSAKVLKRTSTTNTQLCSGGALPSGQLLSLLKFTVEEGIGAQMLAWCWGSPGNWLPHPSSAARVFVCQGCQLACNYLHSLLFSFGWEGAAAYGA